MALIFKKDAGNLSPEKNILDLEKGLGKHSPSSSILSSPQMKNEKEFHDNQRSGRAPLSNKKHSKPEAPLAEPETPRDDHEGDLESTKVGEEGMERLHESHSKDLEKSEKAESKPEHTNQTKRPQARLNDAEAEDGVRLFSKNKFTVRLKTSTIDTLASKYGSWYQMNKSLAQSMMDLALLSANANQLRYVLDSANTHPFYYPNLILISMSLFFQVAVGIAMIASSNFYMNSKDKNIYVNVVQALNNWTIFGVFIVTILNVFITAFSVNSNHN